MTPPGYVVGVDVGGTSIGTALLTADARVVAEFRVPTPPQDGPDAAAPPVEPTTLGDPAAVLGAGLLALRAVEPGATSRFDVG